MQQPLAKHREWLCVSCSARSTGDLIAGLHNSACFASMGLAGLTRRSGIARTLHVRAGLEPGEVGFGKAVLFQRANKASSGIPTATLISETVTASLVRIPTNRRSPMIPSASDQTRSTTPCRMMMTSDP